MLYLGIHPAPLYACSASCCQHEPEPLSEPTGATQFGVYCQRTCFKRQYQASTPAVHPSTPQAARLQASPCRRTTAVSETDPPPRCI